MSTPNISPALAPRLLDLVESFEGGGLTGDFDGQISSWGPLQWNLGQGTLQPLLRHLVALDPGGVAQILPTLPTAVRSGDALRAWFEANVLDQRNRAVATTPAKRAFAQLAALPAARETFTLFAQPYLQRAAADATRLALHTERALALVLDVTVQNGGVRSAHERRYEQLRTPENAFHEWQRLKLLAIAVADCATPQWRTDVLSRKLTIAIGSSRGSGMRVHGMDVDLEEQYGIRYWAVRDRELAVWYG